MFNLTILIGTHEVRADIEFTGDETLFLFLFTWFKPIIIPVEPDTLARINSAAQYAEQMSTPEDWNQDFIRAESAFIRHLGQTPVLLGP